MVRPDGITEAQRRELAKKSASNTSPEAQWFVIFDILFPGHKPRPQSPYVEREILQVMTPFLDFATVHGPGILLEVLDQREAINGERGLAAYLQTVVEVGLSSILDEWFARGSSSTQDSDVLSNSGRDSHDTPRSTSHSRERVVSTSAHDSVAVSRETMSSLTGGGHADVFTNREGVAGSSTVQTSFVEGSDGAFIFEHEGFNFPTRLTHDGSDDELMRLAMDDAQWNSEFQPDMGGER